MNDEQRDRVSPNARGGFDINLSAEERDLLAILPGRMLVALEQLVDPSMTIPDELERLFPPAYPTDASAENAYIRLVREDLLEHHRNALTRLRDSAEMTHLDEAGMESWLTGLTDLRLMLGSSLGVTEEEGETEPSDPNYYNWLCYHYLSQLQHEVVTALSQLLPLPETDAIDRLPDDPWGEPPGGLRWDGTPTPETP